MKGFILKDLLLYRSNTKVFAIIMIVCIFMSVSQQNSIIYILPFFTSLIATSTFGYDDYNKWNAYALTFANGRRKMILGKFASTFLLIAVTTVLAMIISLGISIVEKEFNLSTCVYLPLAMGGASLLVMAIMYPIFYKFGTEKGRIVIFVLMFVVSFGLGLLMKLISGITFPFLELIKFIEKFGIIIFPLILLLTIIISYSICLKIIDKKEY